ncbi:MAG TPA: hypothetical protein VFV50_14645 [Bdellovibrionales bacterium]|nr:hypothetical protein [Bdellovibrionales bacterium]
MKKHLIFALFALVLGACSGDDAQEALKNPELIQLGTVHEEKVQPGLIRVLGGYERDSFAFSGNDVIKTVDVYPTETATSAALTIFYRGTYKRGNDIGGETFEIDLSYGSVEVVARTEDALKLLNSLTFCGKNDFVLGQAANLTNNANDPLCPLDDLPMTVYDIYKIEGERVFFGKGDKTRADARPRELDRDNPFIKR